MTTQKRTEVPVSYEGSGIHKTFDRIQNMIRERADKIFHTRNPDDGDAISDWLRAEAEILTEVNLTLNNEENRFVVEGTVKGFTPEEIEVKAEDGALIIGGIHTEESSDKKKGVTTTSSKQMSFCQSFSLPDSANADKIKAELKGEKFTVTIPKIMH